MYIAMRLRHYGRKHKLAFMTRRQQEHQTILLPSAASNLTKPKISVGEMWRDREVEQPQTGNHKTGGVPKGKAVNEDGGRAHQLSLCLLDNTHLSSKSSRPLTVHLPLMQIKPY